MTIGKIIINHRMPFYASVNETMPRAAMPHPVQQLNLATVKYLLKTLNIVNIYDNLL